jgi:hypothetical protein
MPEFLAPPVAASPSIPARPLGSFPSSVPRGAYWFYAFEDLGGKHIAIEKTECQEIY